MRYQFIIGGVPLAGGGADIHHLLLHVVVHVRVTNHRITGETSIPIQFDALIFTCKGLALRFSPRPCFVSKVVNFTLFTTKC